METAASTEKASSSMESTIPIGVSHCNTHDETTSRRKKVVIVGLGMVAISLMYVANADAGKCRGHADVHSEKILKFDAERRQYEIVVIGEEQHLAYNRVGLSTFFEHRRVEDLYLNSQEWVFIMAILATRRNTILTCTSTRHLRMNRLIII